MSTVTGLAQNVASKLYESHDVFKEKALTERRFKHKDIVPLIEQLKGNGLFEVKNIGKSTQERDIFQIKLGTGKTPVLLWSQMHGDEPTATMAIFDIFNFFKTKGAFENLKKQILENCTLYFVPMLNPDGAEVYKRRTALDIDMNRDALRLQTPEGRLLKKLQNNLQPVFGFNLHDQSPRYSAGNTGNLATISFLATAYNHERSINDVRKRSMQLIVGMNKTLQAFIPNQVARYSDEHEPRAFGDNIQKWGTSLVLIESGGYKNDLEKMYIRKLNFVSILTGLEAIATKNYEKEDIKNYDKIPENGKVIFDLLIKNVKVNKEGQAVVMDIAINRMESVANLPGKFNTRGVIEEMGDLSVFFGTEVLDATGLVIENKDEIKYNGKADFELKKDGKVIFTVKNGVLIR